MAGQSQLTGLDAADRRHLPCPRQHLPDRRTGRDAQDLTVAACLVLDDDLDRQRAPLGLRLAGPLLTVQWLAAQLEAAQGLAAHSPASAAARLTKASTMVWAIWPNRGPRTFASKPLRIS